MKESIDFTEDISILIEPVELIDLKLKNKYSTEENIYSLLESFQGSRFSDENFILKENCEIIHIPKMGVKKQTNVKEEFNPNKNLALLELKPFIVCLKTTKDFGDKLKDKLKINYSGELGNKIINLKLVIPDIKTFKQIFRKEIIF